MTGHQEASSAACTARQRPLVLLVEFDDQGRVLCERGALGSGRASTGGILGRPLLDVFSEYASELAGPLVRAQIGEHAHARISLGGREVDVEFCPAERDAPAVMTVGSPVCEHPRHRPSPVAIERGPETLEPPELTVPVSPGHCDIGSELEAASRLLRQRLGGLRELFVWASPTALPVDVAAPEIRALLCEMVDWAGSVMAVGTTACLTVWSAHVNGPDATGLGLSAGRYVRLQVSVPSAPGAAFRNLQPRPWLASRILERASSTELHVLIRAPGGP